MIRQKANEMGYLPNMAARALKTKMTHNIGVLFIDDYHSGLTSVFCTGFGELKDGGGKSWI